MKSFLKKLLNLEFTNQCKLTREILIFTRDWDPNSKPVDCKKHSFVLSGISIKHDVCGGGGYLFLVCFYSLDNKNASLGIFLRNHKYVDDHFIQNLYVMLNDVNTKLALALA